MPTSKHLVAPKASFTRGCACGMDHCALLISWDIRCSLSLTLPSSVTSCWHHFVPSRLVEDQNPSVYLYCPPDFKNLTHNVRVSPCVRYSQGMHSWGRGTSSEQTAIASTTRTLTPSTRKTKGPTSILRLRKSQCQRLVCFLDTSRLRLSQVHVLNEIPYHRPSRCTCQAQCNWSLLERRSLHAQ